MRGACYLSTSEILTDKRVAFGERGFIRGMASFEGEILVVICYLSVSEILTDKRVAFGECGFIRGWPLVSVAL